MALWSHQESSFFFPGSPFHVPLPPPDSELWDTPDVSLITGDLRPPTAWKPSGDPESSALAPRPQLELIESSPAGKCTKSSSLLAEFFPQIQPCKSQPPSFAALFLSSRSWQGLQPCLGQTPVTGAVSGRRGIAIAYEDEGSN